MCELVEEYAEKRAKRYAEEREMQVKLELAKSLIEITDLSLEHIARVVKLPLASVKELAHGRTA